MINKKYLKLIRSKKKIGIKNFIYDAISERIIDSIDLINIKFENILELGINEDNIYEYLKIKFPHSKFTRLDICLSNIKKNKEYSLLEADIDNCLIDKKKYNLIYSNFYCHLSNNFEKNLKNINDGLKNNGFFIATIPDNENIYQLVNSMYKTDLSLYEGAYQRINPTHNIDYILAMLKKLNFEIPTVHSDLIQIEYSKFKDLIKEIKNMNLSYCYKDKKKLFEKKNYFKIVEKNYKENYFFNNNFLLDIKFNIISAWKK